MSALPEGEPWYFDGWEVSGNTGVAPSRLTKIPTLQRRALWAPWRKRTPLDQASSEEGLQQISRLLESEGYYDHHGHLSWTLDESFHLASAEVAIESGPRMVCAEIELQFPKEKVPHLERELQSKLLLHKGEYFTEAHFQKSQQDLLLVLMDHGHLWAKVNPEAQLNPHLNLARVRYIVEPGPITTTGPTLIKGLNHISEAFVIREFVHTQGETFHFSNLLSTRQKLIGTRWFSSVIITPDPSATEGSTEVPILLELVEAEPRTVGIGLGVGSDVGPRTRLTWQHRNWMGLGWKNKNEFQISTQELRVKSTMDIPYSLRNDASTKASFSYGQDKEDDYKVKTGELEGLWTRQYHRFANYGLGWSLKSEEHDSDSTLLQSLGDPAEAALMNGPILQWARDFKNSLWNGFLFSSIWKGQSYFDTNDSKAGFWQQQITFRLRQDLFGDWEMHDRLKLGWMEEWEGMSIPVSDRYYSGGSSSVRGYSRRNIGPHNPYGDTLGGKSLAEFSIELQHPLWIKNLRGAIFTDGGQLDLKTSGLQISDFQHSIGTGLAYELPMGQMKVDLGIPLNRNSWDAPFQIHFDFGVTL